MNNTDTIKVLQELADSRQKLIDAVGRKKWRPSEKALTVAKYKTQQAALDYAIGALKAISGATETCSEGFSKATEEPKKEEPKVLRIGVPGGTIEIG